MNKIVLLALVSLLAFGTKAQKIDKNGLVQFSGMVVTSDSLVPVPFASVMIKNSNRGTISDYFGFFSFVAKMHDTIEFAAIGFKKAIFVIPDTLTDMRCSMIQILKADTILLRKLSFSLGRQKNNLGKHLFNFAFLMMMLREQKRTLPMIS